MKVKAPWFVLLLARWALFFLFAHQASISHKQESLSLLRISLHFWFGFSVRHPQTPGGTTHSRVAITLHPMTETSSSRMNTPKILSGTWFDFWGVLCRAGSLTSMLLVGPRVFCGSEFVVWHITTPSIGKFRLLPGCLRCYC